jgi:hypothetical protein
MNSPAPKNPVAQPITFNNTFPEVVEEERVSVKDLVKGLNAMSLTVSTLNRPTVPVADVPPVATPILAVANLTASSTPVVTTSLSQRPTLAVDNVPSFEAPSLAAANPPASPIPVVTTTVLQSHNNDDSESELVRDVFDLLRQNRALGVCDEDQVNQVKVQLALSQERTVRAEERICLERGEGSCRGSAFFLREAERSSGGREYREIDEFGGRSGLFTKGQGSLGRARSVV